MDTLKYETSKMLSLRGLSARGGSVLGGKAEYRGNPMSIFTRLLLRQPADRNDQNPFRNLTGFTLIETLVAISIILVTLVFFISAAWLSLRLLGNAERKYIAAKIAQEGMELFISKRNNNVLCLNNSSCTDVTDWQEDLSGGNTCGSAGAEVANDNKGFEIFGNEEALLLAGANLANFHFGHRVCYNSAVLRDRFVHGVGGTCPAGTEIDGNPKRRIRVCDSGNSGGLITSPDVLLVQSIVRWTDRLGNTQTITIEKYLFNTQP